MADDNRFRSNPPPLGSRPAQAASNQGSRDAAGRNDPLAELARLIGQTDPFSEGSTSAPRPGASTPAANRARPQPAMPPQPRRAAAPSDPYGSPLQFDGQMTDHRPRREPRRADFQPSYSPAVNGAPQPQQPSEAYSDDPSLLQGDQIYDDDYEERPRRAVLKVAVLALVFFGVVGTGGFFGYRALFGNVSFGPPPVIKANSAPSKMAPTPSAEASNKQIQDRVGDASSQGGERIVSREEKPVEVKDNSRPVPRMATSGLPGSPGMQAVAEASPAANTDPVGLASAEPKKIRTVAIPAGGTGSTAAPRPAAAPVPTRTAQPPAAAAPGSGPLSLSPQVASAEESARAPFPAATPPRPAATQNDPSRLAALPPATEITAGTYTVQISSQRSEAEAQSSFRSLQAKYPSVLGDRQPIIRRADLGDRGIYYRALVGPFASLDQATQFCGSLKSAGGQCLVQRN